MTTLFDPLQMGEIALSNRIAMAPLTRNRAPGGVPCERMVTYYRQRASAGLVITEGSPIAPLAHGYLDTPGIYTAEQVAGWRRVTDAVHAKGGRIVVQLWHVGRISHTSLLPAGEVPVSSTARAARSRTFTAEGFVPTVHPARAALGGSAAGGGTVPPRGPVRPASRLRRRGSAWCQRLPDRAVPARQHQRPNRRLGRVDRESGAPAAGRDGRPSAARSAAAARGCG
jgi:hypothetical protein